MQTTHEPPSAPSIPLPAQMLRKITAYWVSRAIFHVARAGIADLIGDGAKSAADLAKEAKLHAPSLYRVLRALAFEGLFVERDDGRFALTPLGQTLRTGTPGSMRNFALMMVDDYNWEAWQALGHSLETGEVAFDHVHGKPAFEFMGEHADLRKTFGESMTALSLVESPAVAGAYDFSRFAKIVDVGGSHGMLLSAILQRNPKLQGVLYDRADVIANAKNDVYVTDKSLAGRVEIVAGDFFEHVPPGADACIMKYIIHDWNDERSRVILANCKKAMGPKGTLLVVDTVVRKDDPSFWSKWLDINMMVAVGGKERTEDEFRELFRTAGFKLTRIVPTPSPLSIVEGVPA